MSDQRDFKGIWIPREIWLDTSLNALEKVLFAEIDSLSGYDLMCVKSNASLAEFCQCSESKVSKSIKKLIDAGYVEQVSFDGRHRVLRSRLVKNARQDDTKCYADEHKMTASNTNSNSPSKTDICQSPAKATKTATRSKFVAPTLDEVKAYIAERKSPVDPVHFYNHYDVAGWTQSNGKKIKNWKQCVVTWEANCQKWDRPAQTHTSVAHKPQTVEDATAVVKPKRRDF